MVTDFELNNNRLLQSCLLIMS